MVNTNGMDLMPVRKDSKPTTCMISVDRTINNLVSPPIVAKLPSIAIDVNARKSKRLGRGAVSSGLTCECGVFAAMACGVWPTQRVSKKSDEHSFKFQRKRNLFFIALLIDVD